MTEAEAKAIAEQARGAQEVPKDQRVSTAERRYVRISEAADRRSPAPSRDVLAWVVRFEAGFQWTELTVDDRSGAILRKRWSR